MAPRGAKGYALRRPCAHCPFRTDIPGYLRRERADEIARSLLGGAEFPCHKTTANSDDEDGSRVRTPDSQFCAGAMIVLENEGQPNQMMRVAERLGMYDRTKLDMDAPVAKSLREFISHHGPQDEPEDEDEQEPCDVVNYGCVAPAGELVGGVVMDVEPTGSVSYCKGGCGVNVCEACADDQGRCDSCAEEGVEVIDL